MEAYFNIYTNKAPVLVRGIENICRLAMNEGIEIISLTDGKKIIVHCDGSWEYK